MKTMINLKTDVEIKENAQQIARELGLSLGTVINAYLREFIRSRKVEFSAVPRMTPVLERLLSGVERDVAERQNISRSFASAADMDEYLGLL
jgi:addiction module RelB/DinJ family antitoxin